MRLGQQQVKSISVTRSIRNDANFDPLLGGATLTTIRFDGGIGDDTLILGDQTLAHALTISADDNVAIAGNIAATGLNRR